MSVTKKQNIELPLRKFNSKPMTAWFVVARRHPLYKYWHTRVWILTVKACVIQSDKKFYHQRRSLYSLRADLFLPSSVWLQSYVQWIYFGRLFILFSYQRAVKLSSPKCVCGRCFVTTCLHMKGVRARVSVIM